MILKTELPSYFTVCIGCPNKSGKFKFLIKHVFFEKMLKF